MTGTRIEVPLFPAIEPKRKLPSVGSRGTQDPILKGKSFSHGEVSLRVPRFGSSTPPSPAEIQASFQKWGEWIGKFTQSGQMIDPGDGLQMSGKVVRLAGIVSDGPYVESKEVVGGFSIVQADDYDQAVAIGRECPAVVEGGSVEIRQLAGYMDK